jgi:hypothetical protein
MRVWRVHLIGPYMATGAANDKVYAALTRMRRRAYRMITIPPPNPSTRGLYEVMQLAEENRKLDFSGRVYGAVDDWIWIAQTHPTPDNLTTLSVTDSPPDRLAETFDILINASDTYITIYRLYFKNGELRFELESGLPMEHGDRFIDSLASALLNSLRRRQYPNPADEPPPRTV